VLPAVAGAALAIVVATTFGALSASTERQRNDRAICAALNKVSDGAVGLIDDFAAGRATPAELTAAENKTRTRFPRYDCRAKTLTTIPVRP
jgi:hypothetical protein